jgi:hypothetical protein
MSLKIMQASFPGITQSENDIAKLWLSTKLQAKSFYLPNFKAIYKDWPEDISPSYLDVKHAVDARIKE